MKTFIKMTCVVLVAASLTMAADKPNFSGSWKLDVAKSDLGPIPPPNSMTRKVEQTDTTVTVVEDQKGGAQGDTTATTKYSTDGKESTVSMFGTDAKAKANWDGNALMIQLKADFGGAEIVIAQKWTLSADGKVLTDLWRINSPQGDIDITYVLNKE